MRQFDGSRPAFLTGSNFAPPPPPRVTCQLLLKFLLVTMGRGVLLPSSE